MGMDFKCKHLVVLEWALSTQPCHKDEENDFTLSAEHSIFNTIWLNFIYLFIIIYDYN